MKLHLTILIKDTLDCEKSEITGNNGTTVPETIKSKL